MSTATAEAGDIALVGVHSEDEPADTGPETPNPIPAGVDPASPEGLALYDAETVRRVTEQNELVREAGTAYSVAHERAKDLKKDWEVELIRLHDLIRQRKEFRGKRPEKPAPSLLDALAWRDAPIEDLDLLASVDDVLIAANVRTVGALADQLQAGNGFGLAREVIDDTLERIAKLRGEHPEDPLAELWREFPIAGWTEFGLTGGDVGKLLDGEVKRTGERFPIATVGDLNRFVTPNPANPDFARTYADLKGFGEAAATRLSDAEEKFWKAWKEGGLKEKFAGELGRLPAGENGATSTIELPAAEPSANGDHKPKKGGKKK